MACTDAYTLFHVGGRSAADVDAGGVLPGFTGTIVRDGYAAYQHLTDNLAVPFTNNSAERALRPVKLQQKTSGTWRILQGLANFAAVRSYLDTAHKHGKDALDVLRQLFTTGPWLPQAIAESG